MQTAKDYWTKVIVRLAEDVTYPDPETGERVKAPKGCPVIVQGFDWDGTRWVNGIARPTMHGGGIHVDSARLLNGDLVRNVVVTGGYVASGDVIRSMKGRR